MNASRENFDEFFEKYKPIRNYDDRFTNCEIDGASYTWDTHEDWAMVSIADERHVWTLIETDKGEFIIQGRHFVDRLAYFICEVAYQEDITRPEADRVNASQYLNSKVYDVGDNYNSSTGVYTVPSDGYYQFNVQLGHNLASEGDKVHLYLEKNGSTTIARYGSAQMGDSAGTICIIHGVSTHYLEEGDTLELTIFCQIDNYFSIHPYGFADVTFSSEGDIGCTSIFL